MIRPAALAAARDPRNLKAWTSDEALPRWDALARIKRQAKRRPEHAPHRPRAAPRRAAQRTQAGWGGGGMAAAQAAHNGSWRRKGMSPRQ
jgi:ferric-dicitrate binding protein FerR (iron transport regulator)